VVHQMIKDPHQQHSYTPCLEWSPVHTQEKLGILNRGNWCH
jgi:hypothetical protein